MWEHFENVMKKSSTCFFNNPYEIEPENERVHSVKMTKERHHKILRYKKKYSNKKVKYVRCTHMKAYSKCVVIAKKISIFSLYLASHSVPLFYVHRRND